MFVLNGQNLRVESKEIIEPLIIEPLIGVALGYVKPSLIQISVSPLFWDV